MSSVPSSSEHEPQAEKDTPQKDKTQRIPSKLRHLDGIARNLHNTFDPPKRGSSRNKSRRGSQPTGKREIVTLFAPRPRPAFRSHSFPESAAPQNAPLFANCDNPNESAVSNSPAPTPSPSPSPEGHGMGPSAGTSSHSGNAEHFEVPSIDVAPPLPYSVSSVPSHDPDSVSGYGSHDAGFAFAQAPSSYQSAAIHYPNYADYGYDGSNLMDHTHDKLLATQGPSHLTHPFHGQNPPAPPTSGMIPEQYTSQNPNQETFVQAASTVFVQQALETSYFGQPHGIFSQPLGYEENLAMTVQRDSNVQPFFNDETADSMLMFSSRSSLDNIHPPNLYSPYQNEHPQPQYAPNGGPDSFPNQA